MVTVLRAEQLIPVREAIVAILGAARPCIGGVQVVYYFYTVSGLTLKRSCTQLYSAVARTFYQVTLRGVLFR